MTAFFYFERFSTVHCCIITYTFNLICRMNLPNPSLYTDFYELTMAQGYFLSGKEQQKASFDYFFRKLPFDGGYVIFAGLTDFLNILRNFRFTDEDLSYLSTQGFKDEFLQYLAGFRFEGNIHSVKEGEIVFPGEPLVTVEATLPEAQIIETVLLNFLNFQSLVATKASRMKQSAGGRKVLDFGLRRSQGTGGLQASRAAIIGGADGSSNVLAGKDYNIPVGGTMAHSWVQSFDTELEAFRTYAEHYPENTVLLVDTYDTLKSGMPNAIKVAKELEEQGARLKAVRLDSGDLAYFAGKARKQLDKAGLKYVEIVASNQLDEYVIKSLLDQGAPIDVFGVGTKLVTAYDHPALDGVYKLNEINGRPALKISENIEKITLPGKKRTIRYFNPDGTFRADGILTGEQKEAEQIIHPHFPAKNMDISACASEELMSKVVDEGNIPEQLPGVEESAAYARERLALLKPEHKRFDFPHVYKVGISPELQQLRDRLIKEQK